MNSVTGDIVVVIIDTMQQNIQLAYAERPDFWYFVKKFFF